MIEIRNAYKTYTAKSGISTTAINDVSFKLPNTGMVFIVGKSGAGKSTLLNVLGGLDYLDKGEIIINGKSTKDFTKSEYDSYRNTYVGFVFQEFHILNELSVGENIALAIKLQNKKVNKDVVNFILDEVGLDGYADRRPNELSGGELQRVAIARALIKKPQIIIADEPTGSLDSKTGEQIFETLKTLSLSRLVLVVSHDLEFAAKYAHRIIEVKDGKVIHDVERVQDPKTKNIQFVTTKDKERSEEEQPLKLIKSRMPIKEAFRMGVNALAHKKFRLVASIFLSIVSFTMLGLSSIIGYYNNADVCSQTFIQSPVIDFAHFKKTLISADERTQTGKFGVEDKEILKNAIGIPFTILYKYGYSFKNNLSVDVKDDIDIRYASSFSKVTYIPENELSDFNITVLAGEAPKLDNEIAISKYVYETFAKYGYKDSTEHEIKSPEDMLGKTISNDGGAPLKITAVYDTHFDNHNNFFDKVWEKQEPIMIENADGYEEYEDYVNTLAGSMFINKEMESGGRLNQTIVGVIKDKNSNAVKKMYDFAFAQHNSTNKDKEDNPDYEYAQYSLLDTVTDNALSTIQRTTFLRKLFLSLGIAFVVFSGLLLGNFIANSISYQRKEIGILRAVGARGIDVFKIYSTESLIIALINFTLATLSSFLVFKFIFEPTLLETTSGVVLYSFTYVQILIILAVSIVSALIATFIPVKLNTRQKPIDTIRLK